MNCRSRHRLPTQKIQIQNSVAKCVDRKHYWKSTFCLCKKSFCGWIRNMDICNPDDKFTIQYEKLHRVSKSNLNGILIDAAVFAQFTSECRRACRGMFSPSQFPIPIRDLDHHLICGFMGPGDSASQTAS